MRNPEITKYFSGEGVTLTSTFHLKMNHERRRTVRTPQDEELPCGHPHCQRRKKTTGIIGVVHFFILKILVTTKMWKTANCRVVLLDLYLLLAWNTVPASF